MTNFILTSYEENQKKIATSKAKEDVVHFLSDSGFQELKIILPQSKLKKLMISNRQLKSKMQQLNDGDTILLQYPMYSRFLEKKFHELTKSKKIYKYLMIHDLESLRFYKNDKNKSKEEMDFIKKFDVIISHNDKMTSFLRNQGITNEIINLKIFDYFEETDIKESTKDDPLVLAGNLNKAKFLKENFTTKEIAIFGINQDNSYPSNVSYKGSYDSKELGKHIESSFGLVWDGDKIDSCSGLMGEYTKYNNPHKTSLYISLGIPVIVWKEAAISDFVIQNNIGIAVNSLTEIDQVLAKIDSEQYLALKNNAINMAKKIRTGYFTKKAILDTILK